jgi:hypothetical protein
MDCRKAETAVMRHIEKLLQPAEARDLTTHILKCENCRALYLMMDESADIFTAPAESFHEAPAADFTQRVMALVHADETETEKVTAGDMVLRVLWSLGGVAVGVLMLLVMNPDWAASIALQNAFGYAGMYMEELTAWLSRSEVLHVAINSSLGIAALIFAGLIGGLLYGLHRGEDTARTSIGA